MVQELRISPKPINPNMIFNDIFIDAKISNFNAILKFVNSQEFLKLVPMIGLWRGGGFGFRDLSSLKWISNTKTPIDV